MFEDFSGAEDKVFEQSDKKLEPIAEEIFNKAGLHTDTPPAERSELLSAEIGELPIEMQVQAIEVCVQDAAEIVEDSKIASVLRNIIKTGLGRGLEQDIKDEIVKLAYEIDDGDLLETMLQELEDAGILVRKVKEYRGPAQETKHIETPAEKIEVPVTKVETPVEIVEKVEVVEYDFSGEIVPEGWGLGGSAKLTGDGEIDEVGEGWLRLSENEKRELGYAFNNEPLETENGLTFKFDYSTWGGDGGEGLTFFLVDGKTELEEFNPGAAGGSLGYTARGKTEGMSNAYVGIGFDEHGGFSNSKEGRPGGPGYVRDSVAVRGGGDGFEGYEYIDGTERLREGIDQRKVTERPDQTGEDARHVSITFKPFEESFHMSLEMQFGAEGETKELFSDLEIPGEVPDTLKFGFVGTTWGATNIHEVSNVSVQETVEVETVVEETPVEVEETVVEASAEVLAEKEAPVAKVETPAVKVEAPAVKVEAPAVKVEAPAAKVEAPAAKVEAPAAKVEAPAAKVEAPAAKVETPVEKKQ